MGAGKQDFFLFFFTWGTSTLPTAFMRFLPGKHLLRCQYLHFCTSKASKLKRTSCLLLEELLLARDIAAVAFREHVLSQRRNLRRAQPASVHSYSCTSKASKVSKVSTWAEATIFSPIFAWIGTLNCCLGMMSCGLFCVSICTVVIVQRRTFVLVKQVP